MQKRIVIVLTLMRLVGGWAAAADRSTVSGAGWTVAADPDRGFITIEHERLGIVLGNARLNLRAENGLRPLVNWTIDASVSNQLSIRTPSPPTAWVFKLEPEALRISSISADAVLTAIAPTPSSRVMARLLDARGTPVTWAGTDEVAKGYGGSETRNPSYLPSRNPECMYFALGQVSNLNVHGLFDRKTDTAINFSDETKLQRDTKDPNLLDVTMPVPGNTMLRIFPDYFTKILGVPFYAPFDDSYFRTAPVIWGSWTSYYDQVKEDDIVRNTDWIASNLKPYGFDYVLLDEGYDGERNDITHPIGENHCWIGEWDTKKFPHGPQWLTSHIRSRGLHAGLWIVPNAYACAVKEHPDWYLRDKQGNIIRDYDTPALDSTNPQVLDFLKRLFNTLDGWGFEYYKLDGEHALPAYVPAVDRSRLFDKSSDPIATYRGRLRLIRDTIGPRIFLEGCPAGTPLNGIGYFNSYFTGQDVYNSWQGMYALFSSINANAFLNHLVVYVMPGEGIEVGPAMTLAQAKLARYPSVIETFRQREDPVAKFGTTLPEARTLVSFVSLTGFPYSVASVLPELPQERGVVLTAISSPAAGRNRVVLLRPCAPQASISLACLARSPAAKASTHISDMPGRVTCVLLRYLH